MTSSWLELSDLGVIGRKVLRHYTFRFTAIFPRANELNKLPQFAEKAFSDPALLT